MEKILKQMCLSVWNDFKDCINIFQFRINVTWSFLNWWWVVLLFIYVSSEGQETIRFIFPNCSVLVMECEHTVVFWFWITFSAFFFWSRACPRINERPSERTADPCEVAKDAWECTTHKMYVLTRKYATAVPCQQCTIERHEQKRLPWIWYALQTNWVQTFIFDVEWRSASNMGSELPPRETKGCGLMRSSKRTQGFFVKKPSVLLSVAGITEFMWVQQIAPVPSPVLLLFSQWAKNRSPCLVGTVRYLLHI